MKKILASLVTVVVFMALSITAQAYTITDSSSDGIGSSLGFETYGINVNNFTPGSNTGTISFDIFTDYPENGITVGAWNTLPADLFIYENYKGTDYTWVVPLVDHDSFVAGTWYAAGSVKTSNDFEPLGGGYIYNEDAPVQIATMGNNYGYNSFSGGTVEWFGPESENPLYRIHISTNLYQDDENATFDLFWGTATCGNDPIEGNAAPVPEPSTILLMGVGLLGLAGYSRKRLSKKS